MNEQVENPMPEDESQEGSPAGGETGNEAVDEVVRSLDDLDDRPVGEHVAVFESAHERLRAALAGAAAPSVRPSDRGQR